MRKDDATLYVREHLEAGTSVVVDPTIAVHLSVEEILDMAKEYGREADVKIVAASTDISEFKKASETEVRAIMSNTTVKLFLRV